MSKLGKILLYIAVAGAVADILAAFLSYQKFGEDKTSITHAQQERDSAKSQVDAAKKAADDAAQAEEAAKTELADTQSKFGDLQSKLTAEEKTLTDTNVALTQAQDAQKTAEAQVQQLTSTLGGKDALVKQAQDDLAASQSEVKIIQDQLQETQSQIDQLKKEFKNIGPGYIPPGVSGKVTFVNRAWNFVVLNVGLTNGVVPNGELIIYRGRDFLGKVKVTSAESSTSVADIMPDAKADIQVGDDVLN
jgi:multidrug efflux pump subunit AcrA (membrane-fusion protein)